MGGCVEWGHLRGDGRVGDEVWDVEQSEGWTRRGIQSGV